jgi:hypothetical protein
MLGTAKYDNFADECLEFDLVMVVIAKHLSSQCHRRLAAGS